MSVQFGDAVAFVARGCYPVFAFLSSNILDLGSEYRDRLELKIIKDRTLGLGVNLSSNFLLILTATTMMKVCLDLDKINAFKPE